MGASVKVHLHPFLPGGGLAAGGGADGGDDPWRRKYNLDRSHKLDSDEEEEEEEEENDDGDSAAAVSSPLPPPPPPPPPRGRKGRMSRQAAASEFCQVCNRGFASAKALHGHMRTHPQRTWRGVLPPSMRPGREREVADSLILLSGKGRAAERRKYPCKMCGREFETRQALGGHRASHKRQEGCFARAAGRPPVQPLGEEDCAAQSSALVMGPCPPRTSAVASTSTKTVQEQDSSSGVTRRRALDLNQQLPLQSSDSTNGGSVAGDDRANRNKSSDSGDRNNNGVK